MLIQGIMLLSYFRFLYKRKKTKIIYAPKEVADTEAFQIKPSANILAKLTRISW